MGLFRNALILVAAAPVTALAGDVQVSCDPSGMPDTVSSFLSDVREVSWQRNAAGDYVQESNDTVWDRNQNDSDQSKGKVPTEPWSPEDRTDFQSILDQVPACVRAKSNVERFHRVRGGLGYDQTGIVGIAYGYDNFSREKAHGLLVVTDTFLGNKILNRSLNGDQQMQLALGLVSCRPPKVDPRADLAGQIDPSLRNMSRARVLFHEFVHGITHDQEGNEANKPHSVSYFHERVSRHGSLPNFEKLSAAERTEYEATMTALQAGVRDRAEGCRLTTRRAELLAKAGVPSRYPGDTHSLTDPDEYITILLEKAYYDYDSVFGPGSPYEANEQKWVKAWWERNFGVALTKDNAGTERAFGGAQCANAVAQAPNVNASSAALGYANGGWLRFVTGYFAGF